MTDTLERREAIARIIDPYAWDRRDEFAAILRGEGLSPDPSLAEMQKRSAARRIDAVVADSLAKADAILALSLPAREVSGERARLMHVIDRDRYAVAVVLNNMKKVLAGYSWLSEAGRGAYAYDDDRYQREFGDALLAIEAAMAPLSRLAADKTDCTTDPQKVAEARNAGVDRAALATTPAPREMEADDLRIGDKVEVIGDYAETFRGVDTWIVGIRVHDTGEGLDYTLAEQWPVPNRHWSNYRGQTDGFRRAELRRATLAKLDRSA